jgi:hypothetical protein
VNRKKERKHPRDLRGESISQKCAFKKGLQDAVITIGEVARNYGRSTKMMARARMMRPTADTSVRGTMCPKLALPKSMKTPEQRLGPLAWRVDDSLLPILILGYLRRVVELVSVGGQMPHAGRVNPADGGNFRDRKI